MSGVEKTRTHMTTPDSRPLAAEFRRLVSDFDAVELRNREENRRAAAEQRRRAVAELINVHASEETWRGLLHQAREAAEHGAREFMLKRFPSQLCSDGGRAINASESDWPTTLRGEPAELYHRWESDLRSHGF